MKVWRVQDSEGNGPYWNLGASRWVDTMEKHNNNETHPCPKEDKGLVEIWEAMDSTRRELCRFGFSSLEQLQSWFSVTELEKLAEHGFSIVELEIPDNLVILGHRQVVFERQAA